MPPHPRPRRDRQPSAAPPVPRPPQAAQPAHPTEARTGRRRAVADGLSGATEERGSGAREEAAHSAPPAERGLVSSRAGNPMLEVSGLSVEYATRHGSPVVAVDDVTSA